MSCKYILGYPILSIPGYQVCPGMSMLPHWYMSIPQYYVSRITKYKYILGYAFTLVRISSTYYECSHTNHTSPLVYNGLILIDFLFMNVFRCLMFSAICMHASIINLKHCNCCTLIKNAMKSFSLFVMQVATR